MDTAAAMNQVEQMGLIPVEIYKQVERKHIFTHIEWEMSGIYLEVKETAGDFVWLTGAEIQAQAALPTAFRQFWEGNDHV